jgi:hypothetical protein
MSRDVNGSGLRLSSLRPRLGLLKGEARECGGKAKGVERGLGYGEITVLKQGQGEGIGIYMLCLTTRE